MVALMSTTSPMAATEAMLEGDLEGGSLSNARQVTFASMGFEKAGEGYFSPHGDRIAFQAVPTGAKTYQIYVMDLATKTPKLVSTGRGACTCAYFRPDGQKMIFASSHGYELAPEEVSAPQVTSKSGRYTWDLTPGMNIYEANLDGSGLNQLTHGSDYNAECAYSPDGLSIVFASNRSGSMHIYTMDRDGSHVRQLTHADDCYNGGPFFSPDGKQIIFRADREKAHHLQIYVMDVDGSNERRLTSAEDVAWAPYWHPHGKVIAYTKSMPTPGHYQIYLLNIDTGVEQRLTQSQCFEGLPSFNQAGDQMVWTSRRGRGPCHLFMADFKLPKGLY